ncbi:amidohydrolase family protein [Catenibacillus scindens]|uniref:amidohydrolase family protein n=1 Tax=Catenibacillus scindens TaxID=673271 RepID=UPI00320A4D0A
MKIFDVHTHFTVETGRISEDAEKIGYAVENKSAGEHVKFMERSGIERALLTCPTQKNMDDEDACAAYCRQVNEQGAKLVRDYPERFLFAASLPLPWAKKTVEELEYAVTRLGARAVGLCSNYRGIYLGDPSFEPVFAAIERLGVPVLLHPAAPLVYPKNPMTGKILPMYEFITDTTRTLLDLFAARTLNRHPEVKVVVPHSGSCLPVALDRFYGIMRVKGENVTVPLDQLYFDLACDAFPRGVPILLTLTDPAHILYGTDYPAIPEPVLKGHLHSAMTCPHLQGHVEDVMWGNARKLFGL